MKTSGGLSLLLAVGLLGARPAAAQNPPAPPAVPAPQLQQPRQAAFPPALAVSIGVSGFGGRAESDSGTSHFQFKITSGLTLVGRLQSPLGRHFGLHVGGAVAYRSRSVERDGVPFASDNQSVLALRGEAGLLYRFKPAAPIYFAGAFVLQRLSPSPVRVQAVSAATETGGGFGIGYEFGERPGRDLVGRVELWNYFMQPSAVGYNPGANGVAPTGSAHDFVLSLGLARRIRPR